MNNSRTPVLLILLLALVFITVFASAETVNAQTRYPGPAARENNRSMDEYDRTINRMKNDSKVVKERRMNLFPQINEDFQQMQIIHNEIVRMLQREKGLNYDRLSDLTGDMKRRGIRLRENLALPEPEQEETQGTHSETIDDAHLRKAISDLHELVASFVTSPIFKNLGVVNAKVIDVASMNLNDIISVSDEIKREAKLVSKSAKK